MVTSWRSPLVLALLCSVLHIVALCEQPHEAVPRIMALLGMISEFVAEDMGVADDTSQPDLGLDKDEDLLLHGLKEYTVSAAGAETVPDDGAVRIGRPVPAHVLKTTEPAQASAQRSTLTYGELSHQGIIKLAQTVATLGETSAEYLITEDSVVYDLGSGLGKVVLQLAMLTRAKMLIGVELVESRAKLAQRALRAALDNGLITHQERARVTLAHGDAFLDRRLALASHLYLANTCFSSAMYSQLHELLTSGRLTDLKLVVTLRPLPDSFLVGASDGGGGGDGDVEGAASGGTNSKLALVHTALAETSWATVTLCFYAHHSGGEQAADTGGGGT